MGNEPNELLKIVTSGCDERIFLRPETDANKYHLNPIKFDGLFQRGSCTCGTLTPFGYEVSMNFLASYTEEKYNEILLDQTTRLHNLLNNTELEFDVYYGPSGSDMMYLPLLFQAMLKPGRPIINIVSCPEELGSGSKLAAEFAYYSEWNQFGDRIPMGESISNEIQSKVHYLAAREESGHIADRNQAIRKIIEQNPGEPIVGNLVFGSKSGIKDDLQIIDEFPEIIWVVDMCQFRTDRKLIYDLINKGVMIMVTGSKFYQAPPFCGALLVPSKWTILLKEVSGKPAQFFKRIFTAFDFPESLTNVRENLESFKNKGLRLRWEVALREMEAYLTFPQEESNALIRRWNQVVTGRLAQSDTFQLMPNMELTNDSIVSFMVLVNGSALNNVELKKLFDFLVLNEHEGLDGFNRVFLGQPVQYGEKSFIRLAIGSYSVRRQLLNRRFEPFNDLRMIEIIEESVTKLFA
jgi:hypothetical protein